jgi:hypothetical protein
MKAFRFLESGVTGDCVRERNNSGFEKEPDLHISEPGN